MDNYAILIRGKKKTSWTTMQFNYGLVQMWKPINCTILYIHICVEYDGEYVYIICLHAICLTTFLSESSILCAEHNHVPNGPNLWATVVCCSLVKPDRWPSQAASSEPATPLLAIHIGKRNVWISYGIGTPKSSILIGFSIINHPFWGTPIFGNTHIC